MKKKTALIIEIALPYILTVLIPLLAVFFLGGLIINDYTNAFLTDKEENIRSAFERCIQRTDSAEKLSYIIGKNNQVTAYALKCARGVTPSVEDNVGLSALLRNFQISDDIMTIFFYDTNNHQIVSPDVALSNAEDFFRYSYRIKGLSTGECIEYYNSLSEKYGFMPKMEIGSGVNSTNQQREVVEYRLPLPVNSAAKTHSQLVFVMETGRLFNDMFDVLDINDEFYVYDSSGELIFSNESVYSKQAELYTGGDNRKLEEIEHHLYSMAYTTENRKWSVKVYLPGLTDVMDRAASNKVLIPMILAFVTSTILTVFFTTKKHKEIRELIDLFTDKKIPENRNSKAGRSGYAEVRENAYRLVQENRNFRRNIEKYETSRKYLVLNELIQNTCQDKEYLYESIKNGNLPAGKQLVISCRFSGKDNIQDICEWIRDHISEYTEERTEVFCTAFTEVSCMVSVSNMPDMLQLKKKTEGFIRCCRETLNENIHLGISEIVDSVFNLGNAYSEAKTSLQYAVIYGEAVLTYHEVNDTKNSYDFPAADREKLKNSILSGDTEQVQVMIGEVYRRNVTAADELLSLRALESLKGVLKDILFAVSEQSGVFIEDELLVLDDWKNIHVFFEKLNQASDLLIQKIQSKKNTGHGNSASRIMSFISENYLDSELCIKMISNELGLHENYISSLFYAEYHEHLAAYIEKLRIQKACELIGDLNMTIAAIAKEVGYASDISFRRAFKKTKGVSPKEYREKCLN